MWAFPSLLNESEFLRRGLAGAQAPEVDRELAGDGDDRFLARGAGGEGAFAQDETPAGEGVVGGLEADQAPGGFDEGGADSGVTVLGDAPLEASLAGGVFARTESGVAADLAAVLESLPVTDLAVEQDAGEAPRPRGWAGSAAACSSLLNSPIWRWSWRRRGWVWSSNSRSQKGNSSLA